MTEDEAGAAAAPSTPPSMFAVFRKHDFRFLWTGQLVSTIGSSLTDLAAGILIFQQTKSALAVGLMLMATAIPSLLVGLIAGVFVDRFDQKKIMIVSDLIRAGLVVSIPFLISINVYLLYVVVVLASTVKQFFDPAEQSVLPDVASEEELSAANAFLSISSFGSTAIGFAGAGLLASTGEIALAFYVDALTFLVSAACIFRVRIAALVVEEVTSIGAVVQNLRAGVSMLVGTPILRSTLIVFTPVLFAFGLWNVLLLPFAVGIPPNGLGGTEFEYGLQEGLTSLGFVAGSLLMARYIDRLPEGTWMVVSFVAMGIVGILYGLSSNIWVAIGLVMLSGFMQPPSSISRALILQRNTPREFRGRVFSAFFVSRDVLFLAGMATAGLADVIDIRLLIIVASSLLIGAGLLTQLMPGLGRPAAEWRRAIQLLRTAPGAPTAAPIRAATMADFDRLIAHLPALAVLDERRRGEFIAKAKVREAAPGSTIVTEGEAGDSAYFVLAGLVVAGRPAEDGSYRSLSTMRAGDFFGEIAALTGSRRTANVVADEPTTLLDVPAPTLRGVMDVPSLGTLFLSTLTERLTRTQTADRPRLAGNDQEALRDLRTPKPTVEALPKTY
ncbi:MAG TPA: MFS transporter [Candidatus Limnocylindrales bacterium]|jgi:MFS family permease|nr:MFS transporter [Candidatus Limnocylindrales bacterium]